jgi:hypothetical protein
MANNYTIKFSFICHTLKKLLSIYILILATVTLELIFYQTTIFEIASSNANINKSIQSLMIHSRIIEAAVMSIHFRINSRFFFMTSSFQGGRFDKVRKLVMLDRHPFEHELFKIISRDFPFLQRTIIRESDQRKKNFV